MTIENSFIRKQILNQRYVRSLSDKYLKQMVSLLRRVEKRIAQQPNSIRLQAIRADLDAAINLRLNEITEQMRLDMVEFGIDEAEFTGEVMNANSKVLLRVPDSASIERFLLVKELNIKVGTGSLTMGEALSQFALGQTKQIQRTIMDGLLLGESTRDIAKSVGALATGRPKHQVLALTRTLTNHASAQSRNAFMTENKEVFEGEEWSAVLDSRTTLICAGRDGTIYPVGRGEFPPAHWNCRSVRIPVMADDFLEGSQKSNKKDFDTWLKQQSASFQDEYFSQFPNGKQKAALFRRGGLEIQRFRDETGKNYSLQELRALYPVAFDKANLKMPVSG